MGVFRHGRLTVVEPIEEILTVSSGTPTALGAFVFAMSIETDRQVEQRPILEDPAKSVDQQHVIESYEPGSLPREIAWHHIQTR